MDIDAVALIPHGAPMDDARRIIYHEIQQCEQRILGLRSQLNTYTLVARLPQDVLLYIFAMLTVAGRQPDSMECISVTHVCRRWRSIALGAPALWTKLSSRNLLWTTIMLERSKTALLAVFMDNKSYPVAVPIMKQLSRIRFLTIEHWSAGELQKLHALIRDNSIEAPQLEALSLACDNDPSWSLPPTTFQQTDHLHDLFINKVHIDWNYFPFFRNLTKLRAVDLQSGVQPTWKELITALNQMPTLESLFLDGMLPTVSFNPALDTVFASMPHLQSVIFRDSTSMDAVVTFLNQVKLSPVLKVIKVVDLAGRPNVQEVRALYHAIVKSLPALCSSISYMDISHDEVTGEPRKYIIDCFVTLPEELYESGSYADHEDDPPAFGLDIPCSAELDSTMIFADALDILKPAHITDLRIGDNIEHPPVFALLKQLPELQVIRVVGDGIVNLLEVLYDMHPRSRRKRALVFPKLAEIHICRDYETREEQCVFEDDTWQDLKVFLRQRQLLGVGVRKLCIRECRQILRKTVEDLRKCVGDLSWDGICKSDGEDEEAGEDGEA